MTLEGDTIIQLQKWWDVIIVAFFRSLTTNNRWLPYKKLKAEHHNVSEFFLPPDTHSKYATSKENLEAFLRALRVHLVKDTTIP